MARKAFNTTIDEATKKLIDKWAVGLTRGQVIDAALALYEESRGPKRQGLGDVVVRIEEAMSAESERTGELLKLGRAIADALGVAVGDGVDEPFDAGRAAESLREVGG